MVDSAHLDRLDAFLDERDLEAIWLARSNSFAWLTRGCNVVDVGSDVGVAAAGYDGSSLEVVTATNERERFREEELPDDVTVDAFDWWEGSLAEAVAERSPAPAGADFEVPGLRRVDVSSLRRPLTAADVELAREVFDAIRDAYDELGHPEEWRNHHQGGAAGFAMREWIAAPDSDTTVRLPMTFAWNPTLPGAKSEETALVTEDGYEVLTTTGEWPTSRFEAVSFDAEIPLSDVLVR
ncbi:hypothetical protein [Natronorarus salvus]|uniref:hypothetical protein n=1 Tax=Natronorarus salvus TaxID=3117733 RepID=UPI002F267398